MGRRGWVRQLLRTAGGLLVLGAVTLGAITAASTTRPPAGMTEARTIRATVPGAPPTASSLPTAPVRADAAPMTTTALRGAVDRTRWPTAVRIDALEVQASIEPVGLGDGGTLVIPPSPRDVGWFQGGTVPGEPGVALVTSHLDTRREGRGVFAGLVTLEERDVIVIGHADGSIQRWEVTGRTQHRKDELPDALALRTGPPRLALVTCGGPFDAQARRYRDNVIVWAEPVTSGESRPEVEE